ncbi:AraC family transcriptional regulator ligand-binding domain-containing protein [Pseudophaeobacter sp.]|jgi:AraC-like DNA-binding protein|uniref:AraC family transcriptional regulator n=1 Tax=Pseudophaeobacter sp. TaxID=1971739 RepID=UPI003A96F4CD
MPVDPNPAILPTVSRAFLEDWLQVLRQQCPPQQLQRFLQQSGLAGVDLARPADRVTHDQIVRLYQLVAVETGDEMMGLWSRAIRSGTLKHLCSSMRGASSLSAALFRFCSFWNLLLDDYQLQLQTKDTGLCINLLPRDQAAPLPPQRFGHMLLLKLAHGVASWLAGRELPLAQVGFAFARPTFAQDYPVLFPAPIVFAQDQSQIVFGEQLGDLPVTRSEADMQAFLLRAPRDWIFTSYRTHAFALRLRELLLQSPQLELQLKQAALALHLTPRTLIRRLQDEGSSFQAIKDGLRRDIALRDLTRGLKSIEEIAQDIGFASAANFHRAFRRWTNTTPGEYRRLGLATVSTPNTPQ